MLKTIRAFAALIIVVAVSGLTKALAAPSPPTPPALAKLIISFENDLNNRNIDHFLSLYAPSAEVYLNGVKAPGATTEEIVRGVFKRGYPIKHLTIVSGYNTFAGFYAMNTNHLVNDGFTDCCNNPFLARADLEDGLIKRLYIWYGYSSQFDPTTGRDIGPGWD